MMLIPALASSGSSDGEGDQASTPFNPFILRFNPSNAEVA